MNTRKDNNGKALKAWRALGVGMVERPLRHIASRTNRRDTKGNLILSPQYEVARAWHNLGRGDMVQQIARSLT